MSALSITTMPKLLWPSPKRVALVAPASAPEEGAIEECTRRLNLLGIETFPSHNVKARHRYFAGTIAQRIDDLYEAYERPDVDAVWCIRGGSGAAQLVDHINWNRLTKAPNRPLIGYSDITTLHVAFREHGLPTIHGPVAVEVNKLDLDDALVTESDRWKSFSSIAHALNDPKGQISISTEVSLVNGARSLLVGGNLTVLASICGTTAELRLHEPSFLLLEDIDEPYYALERCFFQLLSNLDCSKISAVFLGEFFQCTADDSESLHLTEIFQEWLNPKKIPIFTGMPMGHNKNNFAWPYGAYGQIKGGTLEWSKQRLEH